MTYAFLKIKQKNPEMKYKVSSPCPVLKSYYLHMLLGFNALLCTTLFCVYK